MKAKKCVTCDNHTFQKDNICVSCKLGLTQMYMELTDLLKKKNGNRRKLHKPGIAAVR
jgi:hypothetical protein